MANDVEITVDTTVACNQCDSGYYLQCPGCNGSTGTIPREALVDLATVHLGSLADEHRSLLDELLRAREHETHRLARADYVENGGRNWRTFHDRRVTELFLRERFSLPAHPFGDCCEPTDDFATEVATLGIVEQGVDVAAAEARKELDE